MSGSSNNTATEENDKKRITSSRGGSERTLLSFTIDLSTTTQSNQTLLQAMMLVKFVFFSTFLFIVNKKQSNAKVRKLVLGPDIFAKKQHLSDKIEKLIFEKCKTSNWKDSLVVIGSSYLLWVIIQYTPDHLYNNLMAWEEFSTNLFGCTKLIHKEGIEYKV
ncbi:hypothetical protein ACTA71_001986 [Dictyostelium dimigraforme]